MIRLRGTAIDSPLPDRLNHGAFPNHLPLTRQRAEALNHHHEFITITS